MAEGLYALRKRLPNQGAVRGHLVGGLPLRIQAVHSRIDGVVQPCPLQARIEVFIALRQQIVDRCIVIHHIRAALNKPKRAGNTDDNRQDHRDDVLDSAQSDRFKAFAPMRHNIV